MSKPINWLGKIERLEENQRRLEREIIKCKRREEQFIFLFKKVIDMHKPNNYQLPDGRKMTMKRFLEILEKVVVHQTEDIVKERNTEDIDLIAEIVKKGEQFDETIDFNENFQEEEEKRDGDDGRTML